ncbi:MAG TPA: peptidoglycan DD-metalloendopeptidase family protein, partial [Armatimonadota bacterium]|nr:peptidoglycan DD-metalloendopeptidase family protein [Armatimonadota bacterium]
AAALLAMLAGLALMTGATGQSAASRLRSNNNKKKRVQTELKNIKAEQATRRNTLSSAQQDARTAKSAYATAKSRLEATRKHLKQARTKHDQFSQRIDRHRSSFGERIRVIYEVGEPSYVEVLLDASTFTDFVERADYMQRVAEHDANYLVRYAGELREAEVLRNDLEVHQAKEEDEARVLNARKAESEAKAAKAESLLKKANTDRASAERQLAELERNSKELEALLARVQRGSGSSNLRYTGKWTGFGSKPIKAGFRVSSRYKMRKHPVTGRYKMHTGIDLACGSGTAIYSAANGRVVHAGWYGAYGIAVVIDHGNGWSTLYGHCSSISTSAGRNVTSGQRIGSVGSTGYSTGPHLHYEVRRWGKHVSPTGY